MRSRLIIRGAAPVLVALFAMAGPAAAAEDEEISHEAEECIHVLEDGGDPEDCHEAPSPILPENNEIIWGALSFTVLFLLLAKYAYPPLRDGMAAREERIRDEVEKAERMQAEASAEESARENELKEARKEASALVEAARKEADDYRTAERGRIDEEIAGLREQAQADADASKQQALAELRGEVATLAIGAAEEVIGQNLDQEANEALVESFIDRVGADNG